MSKVMIVETWVVHRLQDFVALHHDSLLNGYGYSQLIFAQRQQLERPLLPRHTGLASALAPASSLTQQTPCTAMNNRDYSPGS
jgi:hypothetical protein